jgi:hypothetical protein
MVFRRARKKYYPQGLGGRRWSIEQEIHIKSANKSPFLQFFFALAEIRGRVLAVNLTFLEKLDAVYCKSLAVGNWWIDN